MNEEPSVFTKIINRELPGHIVYEDDTVIAFLNISPLQTGHTLVVPKLQERLVWDLPHDLYVHLFEVVRLVAEKQKMVFSPDRVGLVIDGEKVAHAHVHVLPLNGENDLHAPHFTPTQEELADTARMLAL
jgi:histidine triad (HIT) family protein